MPSIDVTDHGNGVVGVTFTHAADGSHISSPQLAEFARTLAEVVQSPDLRAVVLRGEQEFCAGRVGAKGLVNAHEIASDLKLILEVNAQLRNSPVPFVAAVEGRAFGFGCGFATQCDVTVAAETARFALPEMAHGLPPLVVLSYFGKFVPFKRAFELALTSREFGAAEAAALGIVTEVVPHGAALGRAVAFAHRIAALDPASVRLLRAFARRVAGLSDDGEAQTGVAAMALMISERALGPGAG